MGSANIVGFINIANKQLKILQLLIYFSLETMRNKNNITLGQALDKMVSDFKLKGKLDETRIKQDWEQIMGKTIARHTSSVSLKQGKLYITITSASLKQNLTYELDAIKNRINEELGTKAVEQVIIT